jgi:DNA repair exonuclease SbcCD ATPase subunit
VAAVLLSVSATGWCATGTDAFGELADTIGRDLERTTRELDRLSDTLRAPVPREVPPGDTDGTIPRGVSPWVPAPKAAAEVERVRSQLSEIEDNLRTLEALEREIQREKQALEEQRDRLMEEKRDLEDRERLWSMGFYASLSATAAAIIGFMLRLPTFRLERRLTQLEIEQKEMELARARQESGG